MTESESQSYALPKPGDLIAGKYRVEKMIGKGGMGVVFAAQHELMLQRVAVKMLLGEVTSSQEAVQRFFNEARNAARIQNEYVCRVIDVSDSPPFMVLEYLDGLDLAQVLEERGRLTVEDAVDYVLQSLEAIHQAHTMGIVHRDLKPSNLFLHKKQDGNQIVKVLDFGISKAANQLGPGSGALTSTKAMLGSPLYMSPEQLRSSKSVDQRADIWALGVILYELITSTVPYTGDNLGELFAAILETDPVPVRGRVPEVPAALDAVIMNCLQRRAENRIPTVAELARGLAPFSTSRSAALSLVVAARGTGGASVYATTTAPKTMRDQMPSGQFGQAPAGAAQTGPGLPPRGASTVSAVNLPVPPPRMTPQYGATTPMPGLLQGPVTGGNGAITGGNGATTGGMQAVPKSNAPIIAGLVVGVIVMLGVGGGLAVHFAGKSGSKTGPEAALSQTAIVPVVPSSVAIDNTPPPSLSASASTVAPPSSVDPPASAAVATDDHGHGANVNANAQANAGNGSSARNTHGRDPKAGNGTGQVAGNTPPAQPPPPQTVTQPPPQPPPTAKPTTATTASKPPDLFGASH